MGISLVKISLKWNLKFLWMLRKFWWLSNYIKFSLVESVLSNIIVNEIKGI